MEIRSMLAQALGALATLVAAAVYGVALDWLRRELAAAGPRWWASTMRDGVHLGAVAALVGALALFGFPLARAFLLGSLLALAVYGLDYAASRRLTRPPRAVVPLATVLATPVLVFAEDLLPALDTLLARAFGL